MSAFVQALASLHADPNLGEAAIYWPQDGAAVTCRVIRYQPEPVAGLDMRSIRQDGWVFDIRAADVPEPRVGDVLELAPGILPAPIYAGQRNIFDVQPLSDTLTFRVSVQ